MMRTAMLLAFMLTLVACKLTADVDLNALAQSRWQLLQPALTSPRGPLWFEIDADKRTIYGFSGCNRFTGSLGEEGGPLIGTLAQTRMACAGGMDSEQRLGALLDGVSQFALTDGQLQLTNARGEQSLWQAVAKGAD